MEENGIPFKPQDYYVAEKKLPIESGEKRNDVPGIVKRAGGATIWKELNSRLPSPRGAMHELFKNNDGSGSLIPASKDDRNAITMFIEKKKPGKKKSSKEYIDPSIKKIEFVNDGAPIGIVLNKKKVDLSWNGDVKCKEERELVSCSITIGKDASDMAVFSSPKKTGFRRKPSVEKALKRKAQTRDVIITDSMDLWSDAKINVRDINQVAGFGTASALGLASISMYLLPATGLLIASAPMLIGATALANGEAGIGNAKGAWYIDGKMRDDEWIGHLQVHPENVKSVTFHNDDEFYQHVTVKFNSLLKCRIVEESDVLSFYPERRIDCNGK